MPALCPFLPNPTRDFPNLSGGETVFRLAPEPFAEMTARFAASGIHVLGGCCGTTPETYPAPREKVLNRPVSFPDRSMDGGISLTSRSALVRIGAEMPVTLCERVNPTGKKALSAEFQAGSFELALKYAGEQIEAGAKVLDVNVGAPGVDEADFLPSLTRRLVAQFTTPLCLDSSNPAALAAALPWHPGSALLNSISGEPGKIETLGPLVPHMGCTFCSPAPSGKTSARQCIRTNCHYRTTYEAGGRFPDSAPSDYGRRSGPYRRFGSGRAARLPGNCAMVH